MEPIEKFDIKKQGSIYYKSPVCSVAVSIAYGTPLSALDCRVRELSQSFFNQWRFTIDAYQKLYTLFQKLNECRDTAGADTLSAYDVFSTQHEDEFRDYSYLLIISIKTHLDLLACLIDISINQEIREEFRLPDFFTLGRPQHNLPSELKEELDKLRDEQQYSWISCVKDVRDKLIHRGYQLKPSIGFQKTDNLIVQVFQGIDFYTNELKIDIGQIFSSFISDLPKIEETISNILIDKIVLLNKAISCEAAYSYDGLINTYVYSDIQPSE